MDSTCDYTADFSPSKSSEGELETEEEIEINVSDKTIHSIAKIFETLIQENKKIKDYKKILRSQASSPFSNKVKPPITLENYLSRIGEYSGVEASTMIIALVYIDRVVDSSHVIITEYNIHRLLFTSILCASKYNEDSVYDNTYYSEIAGVSIKELNSMEASLAEMLDFKFFVDTDEFNTYMTKCQNLIDSM